MKKKLSVLLVAIFVLPLLSLLGCQKPSSYQISVISNCETSGFPELNGSQVCEGTFEEGTTVELSAISKENNTFIAWVRQGTRLVEDGQDYKIQNTKAEGSDQILKSVLTFTVGEKTEGSYMAMFSDNNMTYAKLSSIKLTDLSKPVESEASEPATTVKTSIDVYQNDNAYSAYSQADFDMTNGDEIETKDIKEILKLSIDEPATLVINFSLLSILEDVDYNLQFRVGVNCLTDTPVTNLDKNSYYTVAYENGVYTIEIVFELPAEGLTGSAGVDLSGEEEPALAKLTLTYKNLGI